MNQELVLRLSKYYRVLHKLKAIGLEKVFSNNLGDAIGVSSALVRKDFSILSIPGNKKGGFEINALINQLNLILGRGKQNEIIIVGCGKIGTVLMQYEEFVAEGIKIVAGFDIKPDSVVKVPNIPVYHINNISNFIMENQIQVGIICVPEIAAPDILSIMVKAGIRGVLNFAAIELKQASPNPEIESELCTIHNVNIGLELEQLFYQISAKNLARPRKQPQEKKKPD